MPIVSVIIPVYKVENYLRKCLDSVINQTFKDIEIICVYDVSDDNSFDILLEYQKQHNNIIILNDGYHSLGTARNAAIKIAKGKYIYFLDSDDYIKNDLLEKAVEILDNNDIDYYCFGSQAFQEDDSVQNADELNCYLKIKCTGLLDVTFSIAFNTNIQVWNKIFKTSLIKENNIKFIDNLAYEDIYFMWSYVFISNKAYFDDTVYHYYRLRKTSAMEIATKNKTFENAIEHLTNWHKLMLRLSKDKLGFKEHFNELLYLLEFYKRRTMEMVSKKDNNKVLKIYNQYKQEMFKLYPIKKLNYFIQNIFSFKKSPDWKHNILTILGIKVKFKRRIICN